MAYKTLHPHSYLSNYISYYSLPAHLPLGHMGVLFLKHTRLTPALQPWHWPLPLPGTLFPQIVNSFKPLLRSYLLNEAKPDHLI